MHTHKKTFWTGIIVLSLLALNSTTVIGPVTAFAQPDTASEAFKNSKAKAADGEQKEALHKHVQSALGKRFAGIVQEGNASTILAKGTISPAERAEFERHKPPATTLHYRTVPHSRAELDQGVADITRSLTQLDTEFGVHSVGIDERANQLVIGTSVKTHTPQQVHAALSNRYKGMPMRIETRSVATAYARHDSPGVFKAGLRLDFTVGSMNLSPCTSGFSMRDGNNFRRALTAGHCMDWSDTAYHAGVQLGFAVNRQFGGDLDAAVLSVIPTSSPWLFQSDDWLVPIYGARDTYYGEPVCFSGIGSGHQCGHVALKNTTTIITMRNGISRVISGMDATTAIGRGGDSGAPVYIDGMGVGIVSGGDSAYTFYTPLRRIMDRWNLRIIDGNEPKKLSPRHSNKCLDIDLGNWGNGSAVQQWQCWQSDNQSFLVEPMYLGYGRWSDNWYQLRAVFSNRCVDFHLGQSYDGGTIQQWDCWGSPGQQFKFVANGGASPEYMLESRNNGKCIDFPINNDNGLRAHQWTCWRGSNQTFRLYERWGF